MKITYDFFSASGPVPAAGRGQFLGAAPGSFLGRVSLAIARAFDRFYLWQRRHVGRRQLQGLDERLLRRYRAEPG